MAGKRGRPKKATADSSPVKVKDRPLKDINVDDPTSIAGKDPSKVYRWGSRRDPGKIARHEAHGYRVTKRSEAQEKGLNAAMLDADPADGTIGNRDVILMEAPAHVVAERKKRQHEQNKLRVKRELEKVAEEGLRAGLMTERQARVLVEEGFTERGMDD